MKKLFISQPMKGKSDEEIAELIGVTKDNFKKNRQRALKELKSFFEK